jgi:hypothetical protein
MKFSHFSRIGKLIGITAVVAFLILASIIFILKNKPSIAAYGAEFLRGIIGEQAVAYLEMYVFKIQDTAEKTTYLLGLEKPSSPWLASSYPRPENTLPIVSAVSTTPKIVPPPELILQTTPLPAWKPAYVTPLGTLKDIGVWQPYIYNSAGQVVAYRTFLQPDPDRPYATTEIVAFNLKLIRLHYQVGFEEPYAPETKKFSDGQIPSQYLLTGVLLAAFNGGFQYTHGFSGSMANGNISAPPHQGFGTVVMYPDGHLQIGEWGKDFNQTPDIVSFRQNGPLLIRNGKINPEVNNSYIWGLTITGSTVTWRTGIATDKDLTTLYYFIGSYITIDILAKAMVAAQAWNAMQLDINNYWPIFETFRLDKGKLVPEPLLPKSMIEHIDRFFYPYARDFFYVTDASSEVN